MQETSAQLGWLDAQRGAMIDHVTRWAQINSHTFNLGGLAAMEAELRDAFAVLDAECRSHELPPVEQVAPHGELVATPLGRALSFVKRPNAKRRVFLGIHMDTVYPVDSPFQDVRLRDDNTLHGPGVADAKGGLAVMLFALAALERSEHAHHIGWEVLINPDEEIGSPGSIGLLQQAAGRCEIGLVFEPSLPDGSLIGSRKGSGNFALVVRGRSAHAGRAPEAGRNAIHLLGELIVKLASLHGRQPGWTVNVGKIEGGEALNRVPDLAIARFNVRVSDAGDEHAIAQQLTSLVEEANSRDGFRVELHGAFLSPPKPLDDATRRLLEQIAACGRTLGLTIHWQSSGGVCDGNKLAAAGLPNVDTLGPRGGDLHSPTEYLLLDSLTERAKLAALLLMRIANVD